MPIRSTALKVAFLSLFLMGCSEQSNYANDAKSFCDIHKKENWTDISTSMPLAEFNKTIVSRESESVKTDEFKKLVQELANIEFYRELYPTAKAKIEKLTGKEWDCPEYQEFYSLRIEKDNPTDSAKKNEVTINISSDHKYYYSGEEIHFDEVNTLPKGLIDTLQTDKDVEVVITMDTGTDDSSLSPVFEFLATNGISNVQVLSEE